MKLYLMSTNAGRSMAINKYNKGYYADKLNSKIRQSVAYDNGIVIINDIEPEDRIETITKNLPKWAKKIALEIGAPKADVEKILLYRMEEYMALDGEN